MDKFLQNTKHYILYTLLFLFPLFFLPLTQEFFITNKLYLLIYGALLLMVVSLIQFITTKKLVWQKEPLDIPVFIFVIATALSILISSPNRVQAILNPNFGLAGIVSLAVLYFYLSRNYRAMKQLKNVVMVSVGLLSLVTIIFFFNPFKNADFPAYFQFLKSPGFNLMGSQLDLAIFLGFFLIISIIDVTKNKNTKYSILNALYPAVISLALLLTGYSLYKQLPTLQLPPFDISWYAAVETLKQPLTALFGVGVDNFASMFTRVKDIYYNQSPLWQINSFAVSRSAVLQIFTETGLFGLVAFGLLLFIVFKQQFNKTTTKHLFSSPLILSTLYLILVLLLFPISLPVTFLFFLLLAIQQSNDATIKSSSIDLAEIIPLFLGIIIIGIAIIGIFAYFTSQSYLAEYYFKKSLDGYMANNAGELYNNQRQAIIINPYIERFHINFSQTNLLLANNIAAKSQKSQSPKNPKTSQLSNQDKQTITQAIQAAIAEAKAAVALNPQKAANWENLAVIYRNILAVAQGADAWTVSAYQRAIVLDPQNPIYRLNLGGVFYSLGNYDQAEQLFEQSASLKQDWANAHYNLAWAAYQKKDYQLAASEMQNVLTLVDPKSDKTDYDKAAQELEQFKKLLPKEGTAATQSAQPSQLTLPTPAPSISPKITLPKEASPEAK